MAATTDQKCDQPYSDAVTHSCQLFEFIWLGVVMGTICLLGIVGNLTNLLIFRGLHKLSDAMLMMLKALAWSDLFHISLFALIVCWPEIVFFVGAGQAVKTPLLYCYAYVWPLVSITLNLSAWYMVLLSIHRYIAVRHPLHSATYSSVSKVSKQIFVVSLLAVVMDVPRFFELRVIELCDVDTNTTYKSIGTTDLYRNKYYQIIYKNVLMTTYRKFIPFGIITVLSTRLIATLYSARRKRTRLTSGNGSDVTVRIPTLRTQTVEYRITKTLIAIMVTFVFLNIPGTIYPILRLVLDDDQKTCGSFYYYFIAVADGLAAANSSVNFIIYVWSSREFANELKAKCCACAKCIPTRGSFHPAQRRSIELRQGVINVAFERRETIYVVY